MGLIYLLLVLGICLFEFVVRVCCSFSFLFFFFPFLIVIFVFVFFYFVRRSIRRFDSFRDEIGFAKILILLFFPIYSNNSGIYSPS
jgi:hypothetical protein